MDAWVAIVLAIVSAAFASGGAYMATRVELRFIWRDLGALVTRVERIEAAGTPRRRWNDPQAGE